MGVEYKHFLVAADPRWLPSDDTFTRVVALLRKWSQSYAANADTIPPEVEVTVPGIFRRHVAWNDAETPFSGWWRGGVILDFGKSVPAFANGVHALPNRAFVRELAEAMRSELHEIGELG